MATSTHLSIIDTAILAMDSPETRMHLGGASIFRLPRDAGPDYVKKLYEAWRGAPVARDPFRHRLVRRSLTDPRPAWQIADDVDLAGHLFHVALPTPGGRRELAELTGRLYTAPFDRSRPLWEIYLIEGLANRRFAMYTRIHHALMDGRTASRVLMTPLSEDSSARDRLPAWSAPVAAREHRDPRSNATGPTTVSGRPGMARRLVGGLTALPSAIAQLRSLAAGDVAAPDSILNRAVTARHYTDSVTLDLARIRAAGQRVGSTVNDVCLAVCGGALRRYLLEIGQLPVESLRALVPVSIDKTGESRSRNLASAMTVPLGTDLDDPQRRLRAITLASQAGKETLRNAAPPYVIALRGALLMAPLAAEQLAGVRLLGRPSYNLAISNVPGPPRKLYLNGAEMEEIVPNFIIGPGMALSLLLTSYHQRLGITVSACPDTLPGVDRLLRTLPDAFAEIEAAVRRTSVRRTRNRRAHGNA